ncbi:MAG TPA: hypothetical protein VK722_06885, partial [Candidatus Aquilonibacter sp.]|nr:hypothetical protein [Candidatus Aquilonibacter sp.]
MNPTSVLASRKHQPESAQQIAVRGEVVVGGVGVRGVRGGREEMEGRVRGWVGRHEVLRTRYVEV